MKLQRCELLLRTRSRLARTSCPSECLILPVWKPLEVATDPSRFIRKYGLAGLLLRATDYPLRPIRRLLDVEVARAERRYYDNAFGREATRLPRPAEVLLYPTCPPPCSYAITKMLSCVGCCIVRAYRPSVRLALVWLDETHVDVPALPGIRCLNCDCTDISKVAVGRAFEQVFGYGFHVDPTTHHGPLVEKSDDNCKHDGRVIEGPAPALPGRVYQRVIDNRISDRSIVDIRTPIIGEEIPFVYLKHRPLHDRFGNTNTRTVRKSTLEVFRADEVNRIVAFSRSMGLDYGELDILRDRRDGRIYIVDVNKTPYGPPNHLRRSEGRRAMRDLGEAFARQFLS
jgi:hypothetical protein